MTRQPRKYVYVLVYESDGVMFDAYSSKAQAMAQAEIERDCIPCRVVRYERSEPKERTR